jgi:hypothetical protein
LPLVSALGCGVDSLDEADTDSDSDTDIGLVPRPGTTGDTPTDDQPDKCPDLTTAAATPPTKPTPPRPNCAVALHPPDDDHSPQPVRPTPTPTSPPHP